MKKGLILESRVISEITRQRELMGLKPIVLNEAAERIPFINKVVKWLIGNAPGTQLSDIIGGSAEKAMLRLKEKNITDLASLNRYLFDDAGVVARNFTGDAEKQIAGAFAKKIFSDSNFSDLANDTVVEYFQRLGKNKEGLDYGETVKRMLTDDLSDPELKQIADATIAKLERTLENNQAVQYLKKVVNDPNRKPFTPDVDVNGPKVDDIDVNTPKIDEPTPDAPNPEDIKFDFGDYNTNDVPTEKIDEIIDDIDFDAFNKGFEADLEPEIVVESYSKAIYKLAEGSRLFRSLAFDEKERVIKEIQADFINTYNKTITDATKKIEGLSNDPATLEKLNRAWNSISTNPTAKEKLLNNALKKTAVTYNWQSKEWLWNVIKLKKGSTGEYRTWNELGNAYLKGIRNAAIVECALITYKLLYEGENIGWDNIPGDNKVMKAVNLLKPANVALRTFVPIIGHIITSFGLDDDFLLNDYRKPSVDEIRKLLGVKTTAAVKVEEITTQNTKYAEYSRTVFINDVNIGDWALRIKDKQLVKMKPGQAIPPDAVDANANAGGNNPAPTPNTTKTTMTKAEVETIATNSSNGYVKPLTFTPNEDNKAEYSVTDNDGDKFKATLNNGAIVITPQ